MKLIFGNKEPIVHAGEGVFGEGVVFLCAEQESDGRVVTLDHHMPSIPSNVGIELADVLVGERLELEVEQDMAFQDAVIEDEVYEAMCVADEDALLPSLETKAVAQL